MRKPGVLENLCLVEFWIYNTRITRNYSVCVIVTDLQGPWVAQSVEWVTPDLGVVHSSSTLTVEITFKKHLWIYDVSHLKYCK